MHAHATLSWFGVMISANDSCVSLLHAGQYPGGINSSKLMNAAKDAGKASSECK
jgi:hypothetical protein